MSRLPEGAAGETAEIQVSREEGRCTFTISGLSDGENKVILHTDDKYKIFALWTPHAPFVCLEPWVDHIEIDDTTTPFEERDVVCLPKGETYHISYSIAIV